MRRQHFPSALLIAAAVLYSVIVGGAPVRAQSSPKPLRVLIVGGGPNLSHNQVAIESNVRYVGRLLPANATTRVMFADGNPKTEDVLCQGADNKPFYRSPRIPTIDAPTNLMSFQYQLDTLAPFDDTSNTPVLLYFTGHGSPEPNSSPESAYANNQYDMWGGDELTVKRLAQELDGLPTTEPVTIVMVQCYSGAFGNLLFKNGDPNGPLVDRNVCGFFASVPNRTAAGCTPEINEANYRDFTGYFFAALSGSDRLGNPVTGADYDHDGHVGMNEAFAYALIHDESIDTPVCTSDTFLRRFVKTPDPEVAKTPYADLLNWAAPAQKAALEGLSDYLKLSGEDRFAQAYARFAARTNDINAPRYVHTLRFVRLAKSIALAHTLDGTSGPALKARFAQLLKAEAGSPIPPFTGSKDQPTTSKPAI